MNSSSITFKKKIMKNFKQIWSKVLLCSKMKAALVRKKRRHNLSRKKTWKKNWKIREKTKIIFADYPEGWQQPSRRPVLSNPTLQKKPNCLSKLLLFWYSSGLSLKSNAKNIWRKFWTKWKLILNLKLKKMKAAENKLLWCKLSVIKLTWRITWMLKKTCWQCEMLEKRGWPRNFVAMKNSRAS